MKTSIVARSILLIAMAIVAASSAISVTHHGWSVWSGCALVCAYAVIIAIVIQMVKAKKP